MGISLILLVSGLAMVILGLTLLVLRKQREIAVSCMIVGLSLILVPPIFVIVNTM